MARDPNREETSTPARQEDVTKRTLLLVLAFAGLVLLALFGAVADLAHGRRPALAA
jgi:hypothetical protein